MVVRRYAERDTWSDFERLVKAQLGDDDDPAFWRAAISSIYRDAEYLCEHNPSNKVITTRVGVCSHWRAPHRVRWTADGGFAYPSGYDGRPFSVQGLPELDWYVDLTWNHHGGRWRPTDTDSLPGTRRVLSFDVAMPARTRRHAQAAVHTIWMPGWPSRPTDELVILYGYRKSKGEWALRATGDTHQERAAFELVADVLAERGDGA